MEIQAIACADEEGLKFSKDSWLYPDMIWMF